jgi:ribosomal protein L37E
MSERNDLKITLECAKCGHKLGLGDSMAGGDSSFSMRGNTNRTECHSAYNASWHLSVEPCSACAQDNVEFRKALQFVVDGVKEMGTE